MIIGFTFLILFLGLGFFLRRKGVNLVFFLEGWNFVTSLLLLSFIVSLLDFLVYTVVFPREVSVVNVMVDILLTVIGFVLMVAINEKEIGPGLEVEV